MKRNLITKCLLMAFVSCLLASCGTDIDAEKCEKMILAHPFFKEVHVTVTDKIVPECEEAYAGCMKNWYFHMRGPNTDAHYYYMYGFTADNLRDLFIEEKKATCIFDLIYTNETIACKYFDERRIGNKMQCKAYFTKYEDGWKLDGIEAGESLFTINTWTGSSVRYNVNFNAYNK